jgi:hypothetical protein
MTQSSTKIDYRSALIGAALVSAIGGLPFNVLPQIINSVFTYFKFTPEQLGYFGSSYLGGYCLATLTAPLWLERLNWKKLSLVGIGLSIVCYLISINLTDKDINLIYAIWAVIGFFAATMTCLGMRVASALDDKEKALGSRQAIELICAAGVFFLMPYAINHYSYPGAVGLLVLVYLGLSFSILKLPGDASKIAHQSEQDLGVTRISKAGWLGLLTFIGFAVGQIGIWAFLGQFAVIHGITESEISFVLAVVKVLGAVSAMSVGLVGARFGLKIPHVISFLGLALGLYLLSMPGGLVTYAAGAWVWEFFLTVSCVYQTAAIARSDPSNKAIILVPAAFAFAGTFGPAIAGHLVSSYGYIYLIGFATMTACIPMMFYLPRKIPGH